MIFTLAQTLCLLVACATASPLIKRQDKCEPSFTGKFQLSIGTETSVGQVGDGQPQGVSQVGDGQPQGVSQISDGQPQGVSQIGDGQVQITQISDGQVQQPSVTQIGDGQPQAGVSQIGDGQPQASGVSQIGDGQPQASGVSQVGDGQPQASGSGSSSSSGTCASGFLTLTLTKNQLIDAQGRLGYIASNNQFQFDNPVQAGGFGQNDWTLCSNGTLANQGSTDFFRCDSGSGFFNLYNINYNPGACNPIKLVIKACS